PRSSGSAESPALPESSALSESVGSPGSLGLPGSSGSLGSLRPPQSPALPGSPTLVGSAEVPFGSGDVTAVVPVCGGDVGPLLAALGEVGAVVVVDDGSPVAVPGAAVRHRHPRGPAAARNAGWPLAGTALVAFLDADCRPQPGWLEPLLAQFADPAVVAVAPRGATTPGESVLARHASVRPPLDLGARPGLAPPGSRVRHLPAA